MHIFSVGQMKFEKMQYLGERFENWASASELPFSQNSYSICLESKEKEKFKYEIFFNFN